jgi:hypothetical protein
VKAVTMINCCFTCCLYDSLLYVHAGSMISAALHAVYMIICYFAYCIYDKLGLSRVSYMIIPCGFYKLLTFVVKSCK